VHAVPSDQRESLRISNVQTEPSLLDETLLATYSTGWRSAVNFMRPAHSAGTPEQ
jgi:hypothetical protein